MPDHGSFIKALAKHPRQYHLFVGLDETDPNATADINVNSINGLADLLKPSTASLDGKNGSSSAKHHSTRGGRKNSRSLSDGKQKEKPSPVKKIPVKDKHPKKSPAKPNLPQINIPKPNDMKKVWFFFKNLAVCACPNKSNFLAI